MGSRRLGLVSLAASLVMVAGTGLFPISAAVASAAASSHPARSSQAPLTAAEGRLLSRDVTQRVIIVLRNGLTATANAPAGQREAAAAAAQRPVLDELKATGSVSVTGLSLVDDIIATVSPGEEARLRANPNVAEVAPDEMVRLASPVEETPGQAGFKAPAGSCPTGKTVQLDPEATENIHAATQSGIGDSAQALGYTGAGVKVGFIADGIDVNNPDFIRGDGQHVFIGYQDFSNSGTGSVTSGGEAFLDASSIAAQGLHVYNLENYGTGLDQPCRIRILGVAPGASLVDLDAFGDSDTDFTAALLEAIDYGTLHDHLNVINESFGENPFPDVETLDLVEQADNAAVARGVTVTVGTGDAGPTDTIGSPSSDPNIILAGASTTFRAYLQSGIAGSVGGPVKVTGWLDNNVSALSSGGVTESGHTVDVLAPGDLNWALCSPFPQKYQACTNFAGQPASVELSGGTSEAAPLTAGVAALVIQAYRKAHGGASPTPAIVKQIIMSTAEDVDAPADQQGAGLIDAYAAVLAARSYPGTTVVPAGHAVLSSATQLDVAAATRTPESLHDSITNDGSGPVTVDVSSRALAPYTSVKTAVVKLTQANSFVSVLRFTVPPGQARLDTRIAYTSATTLSTGPGAVNLTLYAPKGLYAAYNLPQGNGKYGDAGVADPVPGTWTAFIAGAAPSTVHFGAQVAKWTTFGTVSPASVKLAPGATSPLTLRVSTPASPGDEDGSIVLHTAAPRAPGFTTTTTVPVILRSYVPTPDPTTIFTGTLTGGNGRTTDTGVGAYYVVDLPPGEPALSADITTPNAANTFTAELVSPTGIATSTAANSLLTETARGEQLQPELGTQLHVLAPVAGQWTLAINFYNQVSGTALSQPFTVTMSALPAKISEARLPNSAATRLMAGHTYTAHVTVTNTGNTPEAYFVDARLSTSATLPLAPLTTSSDTLPNDQGLTTPTYLVPPDTATVTASVTAPRPAFFDFDDIFGDPDIIAGTATRTDHPVGTFSAVPSVPPGVWAIDPYLDGPDGVHGFKTTTVQTAMSITAKAFDPAVSSATGDLWESAVDTSAGVDPYVAEPGQTVTITVSITPKASAGTTVRGTLYLDDDTAIPEEAADTLATPGVILPGGSQLAALPYEYTVAAP
jgi:Subtilase family